jgi:hypothetical protein
MIVHICDPASKPKDRGYSELRDGKLSDWGVSPLMNGVQFVPPVKADWGVVEAQWANPKASRQSLVTLSSRAGFCFTLVPALRYAMIPPTTIRVGKRKLIGWKDALIPGFGNANGDVFTANIIQMLRRMKHPAAEEKNHNVIDAIGMALAIAKMGPEWLENYEIE